MNVFSKGAWFHDWRGCFHEANEPLLLLAGRGAVFGTSQAALLQRAFGYRRQNEGLHTSHEPTVLDGIVSLMSRKV